jgi:hypothetical protein
VTRERRRGGCLLRRSSSACEFSTSCERHAPLNSGSLTRTMTSWPTRSEGTMQTIQDIQTFVIMAVPTVIVVLAALISAL